MCVTEIWTYLECGCFYNHCVLCQRYQNRNSPCFAPKVRYPLDQWLQGLETVDDPAHAHCDRGEISTEPQNCPNHRTMQKSFLNQICEECLLAELGTEPPPHDGEAIPYEPLLNIQEHGEGLIWDSEVKIEIEGYTSGSPTTPHVQEGSLSPDNDDQTRILESQVEITIEEDGIDRLTTDSASPISNVSETNDVHRPPSTATSSRSQPRADVNRSFSPSDRSTKYRHDKHGGLSDFDDTDDERGRTSERCHFNARGSPRGKCVTRSHLRNVHEYAPVGSNSAQRLDSKAAVQPVTRFQGLRSLSSTFLSGPKSGLGANNALAPPTSTPKPFFRSLRNRKGSHLSPQPTVLQTEPLGTAPGFLSALQAGGVESERTSRNSLRKPSIKDLTLQLMHDLKRGKAIGSRAGSQSDSLAPSPTSAGLTQGSDSQSDTIFETGSGASSVEDHVQQPGETRNGWAGEIPGIPKSSTMHTLRAVINDLSLGLDVERASGSQGSHPREDRMMGSCRITDVAELGLIGMPEMLQQDMVQPSGLTAGSHTP